MRGQSSPVRAAGLQPVTATTTERTKAMGEARLAPQLSELGLSFPAAGGRGPGGHFWRTEPRSCLDAAGLWRRPGSRLCGIGCGAALLASRGTGWKHLRTSSSPRRGCCVGLEAVALLRIPLCAGGEDPKLQSALLALRNVARWRWPNLQVLLVPIWKPF